MVPPSQFAEEQLGEEITHGGPRVRLDARDIIVRTYVRHADQGDTSCRYAVVLTPQRLGQAVDRSEVTELHYIVHLGNIRSILTKGILSHAKAKRVKHRDVALAEVQGRRANVTIPNGLRLHDYANLYFNARNCMMNSLRTQHTDLGVIDVSPTVLDLPNVVISDRNSAAGAVKFGTRQEMLPALDRDRIHAVWWNHEDPWEKLEHKQTMCAEVLVPNSIPSRFIRRVYVSCPETLAVCEEAGFSVPFKLNRYLFFRGHND